MVVTKADVLREFKLFLRISGLDKTLDDEKSFSAVIDGMKKTAQARGLSQAEIETIYDADALLEIYHEMLRKRH